MSYSLMLNVILINAECHMKALYAECHYAECRYAECRGAFRTDWQASLAARHSAQNQSALSIVMLGLLFVKCCYAGCHLPIIACFFK
jgi:hypothetical protein